MEYRLHNGIERISETWVGAGMEVPRSLAPKRPNASLASHPTRPSGCAGSCGVVRDDQWHVTLTAVAPRRHDDNEFPRYVYAKLGIE
jgi:hypothetical protein